MSISGSKAEFTCQKLNNGDIYEGYMQNGKRNGQGKYTFASGAFYEGEWKNHKQHGRGRYVSSKGWSYEGDWRNDKMHGRGRYTYADGSWYEGEFANDKFEGQGRRVFASGAAYEGGWHSDKMHGSGRYTFADGSYYEGELADGKFDGSGKQVSQNGDVYEGQWKNDLRHGKGTYRWANGDTYEGDWADGKRCGYGIFTAFGTRQPGGERFAEYSYAGEWRDSLKHGHGICIEGDRALDPTVKVLEGEWENNMRQGRFVWYSLHADGTRSRRLIDVYKDGRVVSQNLPYDGDDADEDDDAPAGPMVRGTMSLSHLSDWQSVRSGEHREAQKRDADRKAAVEELIDIYLHPRKFAQLSEIGDRNIEEACLFLGQYLHEAEELFLDDRTPERRAYRRDPRRDVSRRRAVYHRRQHGIFQRFPLGRAAMSHGHDPRQRQKRRAHRRGGGEYRLLCVENGRRNRPVSRCRPSVGRMGTGLRCRLPLAAAHGGNRRQLGFQLLRRRGHLQPGGRPLHDGVGLPSV